MEKPSFLIVVDMQNDFIDGALGSPEACAIVAAVTERIRECRKAGVTVIGTLDTHPENYMETREGKFLPVPHCIKGTPGWQLNPEVAEAMAGCPLVEKPTFGSVRLPQIVRDIADGEPGSVELLGLCTDICVVSNALMLKAAFPEADFSVRADCCAGVTPAKHEAALETMASCQIRIIR